jgi:hypothetical protein
MVGHGQPSLIRLREWRPILPPACCGVTARLPPPASSNLACPRPPSARPLVRTGCTRSSTTVTALGTPGRQRRAAAHPQRARLGPDRYSLIAEAAGALQARSFLLDGEVVACDGDGVPTFDRLRYRHRSA